MANITWWADPTHYNFLTLGQAYNNTEGFILGMTATAYAAFFSPNSGYVAIRPVPQNGPLFSPTWYGNSGAATYLADIGSTTGYTYAFQFAQNAAPGTFTQYTTTPLNSLPIWYSSQPNPSGVFLIQGNLSAAYGFTSAGALTTGSLLSPLGWSQTVRLAAPSQATGLVWGTLNGNSTTDSIAFWLQPSGMSGTFTSSSGTLWNTGMNYAPCSCASGSNLILGMQMPALFASGVQSFAFSSTSPIVMAGFAPSSNITGVTGTIQAWQQPTNYPDIWTFIGQSTGFTFSSGTVAAWASATGLVSFDAPNSQFVFYSYTNGAFAAPITITNMTGAVSAIGLYQNTTAIVPQTSTSGFLLFTTTNSVSWNYNTSVTGLANLVQPGQMDLYSKFIGVCVSGGLYIGTWNSQGTVSTVNYFPLGYTPSTVSANGQGQFCVAGISGISLVDPVSGVIASGVVPSDLTPYTITSYMGQYFLITRTPYYFSFAYQPWTSGLVFQSSGALYGNGQLNSLTTTGMVAQITSGITFTNCLAFVNNSFLAASASGVMMYQINYPYQLSPIFGGGYLSVSSSFVQSNISGLPAHFIPNTAAIDSAGIVRLFCSNGYSFSLSAVPSGLAAYNAQTVWASGGGIVGVASGASGMFGAAALTNAIVQFS